MSKSFLYFDFGRPRHQIYITRESQDAARASAAKKAPLSNRGRRGIKYRKSGKFDKSEEAMDQEKKKFYSQ